MSPLSEAQLGAIRARYVAHADEGWEADPNGPFELRPLGLADASGGALGAIRLRATANGGTSPWSTSDADLEAIYVLRGELIVDGADGQRTELGPNDVIARTRGAASRIAARSPDFEGIAVSARGEAEAPASDPAGKLLVARDAPEASVLGAGPRPEVIYRDLGVAEATGGAYRLWVVKSSQPATDMSIWHFHDMAQWFVVLDGWAHIEVNGHDPVEVRPGDALCIGAGPAMRHNVSDIGEGFTILELCAPAEYGTWPGEPGVRPAENAA